MKNTLLIAALITTTAAAQTVPRIEAEPRETAPITASPETDPTNGAIVASEQIKLDAASIQAAIDQQNNNSPAPETADENNENDSDTYPSPFKQEFSVPGDDEDRIHCGGDVHDKTIPDFAPYQGVRCTTTYPVRGKLAQPRPADCELAWIATFALPAKGEAEVRWQCRGDTDFSYSNTLALEDGQSLKGDGWQCQRTGDSITCENANKHGFTIGSKAQKLF